MLTLSIIVVIEMVALAFGLLRGGEEPAGTP